MDTQGYVQKVNIIPSIQGSTMACAWIGDSPYSSEQFTITRQSADSAEVGAFKNSIVDALVVAKANRLKVGVNHNGGVINYLSILDG